MTASTSRIGSTKEITGLSVGWARFQLWMTPKLSPLCGVISANATSRQASHSMIEIKIHSSHENKTHSNILARRFRRYPRNHRQIAAGIRRDALRKSEKRLHHLFLFRPNG